ncbi:hypothetical protein BH11PSE12_BH11PSE12_25980 [soil metagenome]
MTDSKTPIAIPHRANTEETCEWLSAQTGTPWNLARLIEHGLTPYVWLDQSAPYAADYPELFTEGISGYPAPLISAEDTQRLAAGSADVLLRLTRDGDNIVIQLKPPGIHMPLDGLRFFQRDIARLAQDLLHPPEPEAVLVASPRESLKGISKEQLISAFAGVVKIDLEKALASASGVFGDDGARVRKNSRAGKNTHLWNPVTLALGLHDTYRVPMRHLKKVFATQPCLREWNEAWLESLALLGE